MNITALQKAAAQAIVNIFETGSIRGNYADVTLMRGDTGQLTYGRSQTTLASGNLYLLIQDYTEEKSGAYCAGFTAYLPQLQACDCALNSDTQFKTLLREAGCDPVMQDVQDQFFDRVYWDPAMRSADAIGAQTALGAAIVYDSTVHGSWAKIRDRVRGKFGELSAIGEDKWMAHYVDERRDWLATAPNPLLHKCVYRMDSFKAIIHAGNWKLSLPLVVRGLSITTDSLNDTAPAKVAAESMPHRLLLLKSPPMSGPDVSWLQDRLSRSGFAVSATGSFDQATDKAVRAFQESRDLKTDGMVGLATRSALEDLTLSIPAKAALAEEPMPAVAPDLSVLKAVVPKIQQQQEQPPPAVSDLKQHVTDEVASLRQELRGNKKGAKTNAPVTTAVRQRVSKIASSNSHTTWAAGLSAVVLALTQARDALAWVQAQAATPAATALGRSLHLPALPRSSADVGPFLTQVYVTVQHLAAALPNDWVFRIRAVAFALVCYALYRLASRSARLHALEGDIAQGEAIEQNMLNAVNAVRAAE